MHCAEFEDRLTDYLDDALEVSMQRDVAAHALRCPVCHDLLNEVKNALVECRESAPPQPSPGLEARIIMKTAPETSMSCEQFEEHLTDYLDGFLPASLYHRWERHAALCQQCTELPGQVVRSIGACYSYISEERPLPAGLHARILQSTLGTTEVGDVRAPLPSRIAALLRDWLDSIVQPQLATVATMILIAVLVGITTISDDGSIGGMYRASLRLAAQTANQAERVTEDLETLVAPAGSGAADRQVQPDKAGDANQKQPEK
jgi:anti-sigma factor RsiW